MPSLRTVKDATEDGGGIEDGPAHIVKTARFADEGAGVHVPNEAIVFYARVRRRRWSHSQLILPGVVEGTASCWVVDCVCILLHVGGLVINDIIDSSDVSVSLYTSRT